MCEPDAAVLCPSVPAATDAGVVFGIVGRDERAPVAYLRETVPVTEALLAHIAPAAPNAVLRTAATCAERACKHFDGTDCTLVTRIVDLLPVAVERPPPCPIRSGCRWWKQEGRAACLRCPQVITDGSTASDAYIAAMTPPP